MRLVAWALTAVLGGCGVSHRVGTGTDGGASPGSEDAGAADDAHTGAADGAAAADGGCCVEPPEECNGLDDDGDDQGEAEGRYGALLLGMPASYIAVQYPASLRGVPYACSPWRAARKSRMASLV